MAEVPMADGAEAVVAALPQPALLLDTAGCIRLANAALHRSLDGAWLIRAGEAAAGVFPEAAAAMASALRGETPEMVALGRGGLLRALPLGTGGAILLLQPAMAGSARLEILGRLAGGIAHDFNNLLGVVLAAAGALRPHAGAREARLELDAMEAAAHRGTALVHQLLAFARQQVMAPRIVELNESVRQITQLLPRLLGEGIALELALGEPSPHVRVDPSQWDQVLLNLLVNARDAMKGRGQLRIATGRRLVLTGEALAPGRYVTLEISDNGPGIPPEIAARIFEPFFTTRLAEGGTGLGLATVQGIVAQFGGQIEVESRPGATTFRVILPWHDGPFEVEAPLPTGTKPVRDGPVLLVDDEPTLLRAAQFRMRQAGFDVAVAGDAEEALAQLEAGLVPSLLATDVAMPGMGGIELARAVRERHAELPILLLSGYAASTIVPDLAGEALHFLAKPYSPEALVAAVRKALGTA